MTFSTLLLSWMQEIETKLQKTEIINIPTMFQELADAPHLDINIPMYRQVDQGAGRKTNLCKNLYLVNKNITTTNNNNNNSQACLTLQPKLFPPFIMPLSK